MGSIMQAAGGVALSVALFVLLPWGLALAVVGGLVLVAGVGVEVANRPREIVTARAPGPPQVRDGGRPDWAAERDRQASGR